MAHNVLLVEDDRVIARIVEKYLSADGFGVTWCASADEVDALGEASFDVALLDIMLPGASGFDVCARLRSRYDCPIIFVSCLDDSESIVKALEMGGDDYITKPFDAKVLAARIKANLRRAGSYHRDSQLEDCYRCDAFSFDISAHRVTSSDGRVSDLTPLEFQVLLFLMRNPGSYYTTEELYYNVWGRNSYGDARTVIVLIHSLRAKVEPDQRNPRYLVNRRGRGYAFIPDE